MRMSGHVALAVLVGAVPACTPTEGVVSTSSPAPTPSREGPFVDFDPDGLVIDTRWVDPTGATPALAQPIAADSPGAVLVDESPGDTLRIAVNGSGCVPDVHLAIDGDQEVVEIEVSVFEAVPDPGIQCPSLLTTHAFDIQLSASAVGREVSITVVR